MLGPGTLIAFATAPREDGARQRRRQQPVLDGARGLELQQMLTRVRAEVVATTNKQVPWSLRGEVYPGRGDGTKSRHSGIACKRETQLAPQFRDSGFVASPRPE